MAHYNISAEGSYTLADLQAKLQSITWEWDVNYEEGTAEFEAEQNKFRDALSIYESIRVTYLRQFSDPRMADKGELKRFANVWDKYTPDKYHVPRVGM